MGASYPRLNPLRVRTRRAVDGSWSAKYVRRNETSSVSGCGSRREALAELRRFVGMKVVEVGGRFVEVLHDHDCSLHACWRKVCACGEAHE